MTPNAIALDSGLALETAEGVVFRLPLAGPVTRLCALAIDVGIVAAAANLVSLLLDVALHRMAGLGPLVSGLLVFFLSLGYAGVLEAVWGGQTIGKRVLSLRVVDRTGLPLRAEQAWVRNLMRVLDALPIGYLVGGAAMLASPWLQRFGDRVAGTIVVRETPLAAPAAELWSQQKYNSFLDSPALALRLRRAATPALAGLVQEALRRRSELAPYARHELYRDIVAYIQREIVAFPDEVLETLSDEQYLINVAGVLFARQSWRKPNAPAS